MLLFGKLSHVLREWKYNGLYSLKEDKKGLLITRILFLAGKEMPFTQPHTATMEGVPNLEALS